MRLYILTVLTLLLCAGSMAEAASGTLGVSAVVLSDNTCRFRTTAGNINFGNLDPSSSTNVSNSTSVIFRCGGADTWATYYVSDDGLYDTGSGGHRMRNSTVTTEYLPYTLTLTPRTATIRRRTNQTLTITGTVFAADYQNAYVGSYQDRITITIVP